MTSLETRSTSALFKRAEQLKRWQESETAKESSEPRTARVKRQHNGAAAAAASSDRPRPCKVQFTDGCVFLAACAAGDKEEVSRLVERGADIDTANVDGLTALHQACIDDNLEMVEFLVQRGADVNRGDNEGWTPLHATASCGFLSIARYLLDHGANVSSVNNDGELAIDISESDEMEELLQTEIDARGIDAEASRNTEERLMMEDARRWISERRFGDIQHAKTGATALHVAAAKGYVKVMSLLLQSGAQVNAQDFDGWTPLHAAAHWGQREACEMLADKFANMDVKNCVGQTCFDVADPDVVRLLEELKRKQANMQKDRPEVKNLINRPPVPAAVVPSAASPAAAAANTGATGKRSSVTSLNDNHNHKMGSIMSNNSSCSNNVDSERTSITRLSLDDKALRSKDSSTQERDLLLNKSEAAKAKEEEESKSDTESPSSSSSSEDAESLSEEELSESELIHARTKAGLEATKRNRANNFDLGIPRIITTPTKEDPQGSLARTTWERKKTAAEPQPPSPKVADADEVHPWRRPASLRTRPTVAASVTSSKLSPNKVEEKKDEELEDDIQLRRVHSFESDEKFYARLTELRQRIRATSMPALPGEETPTHCDQQQNSSNRLAAGAAATTAVSVRGGNNRGDGVAVVGGGGSVQRTLSSDYASLPRAASSNRRPLPSLPEMSSPTTMMPLARSVSLRAAAAVERSKQPSDERIAAADDDDDSGSEVNRPRAVSTTNTPVITELMQSSSRQPPTNLDLWKRREDQSNRPKSEPSKVSPQPAQIRSTPEEKGSSTPEILSQLAAAEKAGITNVFKSFFKSFVPPVRDEESETQRKAHAKRVRETRRSTQGVTLEDLKSAEQLVKKKQQQENQARTSELQQLVQQQQTDKVGSTSSGTTTTQKTAAAAAAATSPAEDPKQQDRRPSWRLKVDSNDKNRFRLEDATSPVGSIASRSEDFSSALRGRNAVQKVPAIPTISLTADDRDSGGASSPSTPTKQAIQRRKKPKRRSTGVVQLDMEDHDKDSDEDDEDEDDPQSGNRQSLNSEARGGTTSSATVTSGQKPTSSTSLSASGSRSQNGGDVDYKKLWEESQKENGRLRDDLVKLRDDLSACKRKLEAAVAAVQTSSSNATLSDSEKREKKALEKKLSEMEEELKNLQTLKSENERLKSENRALTRVVSKLTAASGASASATSSAHNSGGGSGSGVGGVGATTRHPQSYTGSRKRF